MPSTTSSPVQLEPAVAGLQTWRLPELERESGHGLHLYVCTWEPNPSDQAVSHWVDLLDSTQRSRFLRIGSSSGRHRFAASHAAATRTVPEHQLWQSGRASLSHTQGLAVIARSDVVVGVDVEIDIPRRHWRLADRVVWPRSPSDQWSTFLRRWVRREARFKAGVTANHGLTLVRRVRLFPDGPSWLIAVALAPTPKVGLVAGGDGP